jgi:cytochrome P450 family 110
MRTNKTLPDGREMSVFQQRMKQMFQPLEYMEELRKVYGDNFTIKNKSGNHIVYFSHPLALKQIFTADTNKLEVGKGNEILKYIVGSNSVALLDGEPHRHQRKLLAPSFHGDKMRAYGNAIGEITKQVIKNWQDGKPFNIHDSMQEITMRVILRVVFGFDEGQRLEELRQVLTKLLELAGHPMISGALLFSFWQRDLGAWSPWNRLLRLLEKADNLIYSHIREIRASKNQNRNDILSLLMTARYDDGQAMSDIELRDELMTMLVAGHETSTSALVWAFYWVARLPTVREKLQTELEIGGMEPSAIALLPYLTAVCQEALRIYPVATSSFSRVVKSSLEIMGYQLPVNTLIIPSIYLAHHREETYTNPKQFIPERFLERQFSPYEYLPFGGGNRRCLGMSFAMYEMKIVLATILSQYQISLFNQHPVTPVRRGLILTAPVGMKMVATSVTEQSMPLILTFS